MKIVPFEDATLRIKLAKSAAGKATVRETVTWITDRYFRGVSELSDVLETFARACTSILQAGENNEHANLIAEMLGYAVAYRFNIQGEEGAKQAERVRKQLAGRGSKIGRYFRAIEKAANDLLFVTRVATNADRAGRFTKAGIAFAGSAMMANSTEFLFDAIQQFRRYSIKPSLYRSPMLPSGWEYTDALDVPLKAGAAFIAEGTIASARMVLRPSGLKPRGIIEAIADDMHRAGHDETNLETYIRADGEWDISQGYDIIPVREIFEREGCVSLYNGLRLVAAVRMFDLTVARVTVERVNQMLPRFARWMHQLNPNAPIPALLLPRLRVLESEYATVNREIDLEVEDGVARMTRNHRVEAHPRRLPPGAKPSPAALELARRYNVRLLPGETFVRCHRRGNIEYVLPDRREVSTRY